MVANIYYQYSSEFDYIKYLEEKSHTDTIILSIDDAAQKIVGQREDVARKLYSSQNSIANQISSINDNLDQSFSDVNSNLENINDSIDKGFNQISIDLGVIGNNISSMSAICDFGFESLINLLTSSNELLGKVVGALQTPDQTKANENYELALRCTTDRFWSEALEYINIAIHGNEHFPGYKLDPKFYFLRGIIFSGTTGSTIDLVDLSKAIADFISAKKYCAGNNDHLKAEALSNAAWCLYCMGQADKAIEYFIESLNVAENYVTVKSMFLLSKAYIHIDNVDSAKKWFSAAVLNDETYYVRSLNDPDFIKYRALIDEWALEVKLLIENTIASRISDNFPVGAVQNLQELANKEDIEFKGSNKIISLLGKYSSKGCTLSELVTFNILYPHFAGEANSSITDTIRSLDSKSMRLIKRAPYSKPIEESLSSSQKGKLDESDPLGAGAGLGFVIGVSVAALSTLYMTVNADGVFEKILAFVLGGVFFGAAGAFGGPLIGTMIISPIVIFRKRAQKINFEQDNHNEYLGKLEAYEVHRQEVFKDNDHGSKLENVINTIKEFIPKGSDSGTGCVKTQIQ